MSAVLGGVKDIREAVERAQAARTTGRATVVFVDEVHRFNKSQQDAFLPHVESGLFTFIGATTENPSFEVNSALLSRATVHVLKPLDDDDLETLLDRAQALLEAPPLVDAARERLIGYADGDARRLLNAYENLVATVRARAQRRARSTRPPSTRHRRTHARARARRAAAPLRQGRRAVLRHHLGAAQGGARQRPRRLALLVRSHDRRRRRPALRGAPPGADGERGHRPGRPARACASRSTPPRPTSGSARPRASWRSPRRSSTWRWRRRATPSTPPTTRRARSSRATAPGRCRCACATRRPR